MLSAVPAPARWLGLAGLIPFLACAIAVWSGVGWIQAEGLGLQLGYAAVIVTFLGGVHWGRALAPGAGPGWPGLIWSVTPSLIAWLALRMYPTSGLLVLMAAFVLAFWIDRRAVKIGLFPEWYLALRQVLTLGAMLCLAATVARLITL